MSETGSIRAFLACLASIVTIISSIMSTMGYTLLPPHPLFNDLQAVTGAATSALTSVAAPTPTIVQPTQLRNVEPVDNTALPGTFSAAAAAPAQPESVQEQLPAQSASVSRYCDGRPNVAWSYDVGSKTPIVWKCSEGSYFAFQCYNKSVYLITDGNNSFSGAYVYQKNKYLPGYDQQFAPFVSNELNYYLLTRDKNGMDQFYIFRNAQYFEMNKAEDNVILDLKNVARLTRKHFPAACVKRALI